MSSYVTGYGNSEDAKAQGYVFLMPQPLPPTPDSLLNDQNSDSLPDLFATDPDYGDPPTALRIQPKNIPLKPQVNSTHKAAEIEALPSHSRPIRINGKPINHLTQALGLAPIKGLSQNSYFGTVPARHKNGLTPLSAYARPFQSLAEKKNVSIVIGGLGIHSALTLKAIHDLPPEITLSFASHAPNLQDWINQARAAGHEVLLEVPMESKEKETSKGPKHILETTNIAQNTQHLNWHLSRGHGYFGITNYNGDRFLSRTDVLLPFIQNLANSGLGFIYDGAVPITSLPLLAKSASLPYQSAYILLDTDRSQNAIKSKLERLTAQAKLGNAPIAFGFAFPETLQAVSAWSTSLDTQNLVLSPASSTLQ